jgi:hypothetical protein
VGPHDNPAASCKRSPGCDIFILLGNKQSGAVFMSPPGGFSDSLHRPEIIAALCNKAIPARNEPVIGGSLTNHIAKTARSLIARFVSGLQATKANKTVDSQPPSTHAPAATYSSSQHKDTLHVHRIVVVIDPEETIRLHLALGGEGSTK